ncbi:hypothetical protein F6X40_27870 [Paraburkholderia sp. UCT31]|uniref:hypothetical protein n=1 Tax=Paraburkholderia sp. UCT31 TaxID=2615209 RepID=UPI00165550A5|nr:hypothetical protein [Paraburkholderia sp. UCT31]MBC8740458.1 hypothetical protein [Paraburkholderia sp. UCT31]
MPKNQSVGIPLTPRQLNMVDELLTAGLTSMAANLRGATDEREIAFYEKQSAAYTEFREMLRSVAEKGSAGPAQKVRVSVEQYLTVSAAVGARNRAQVLAIHELPTGMERARRLVAFDEWAQLAEAVARVDPRRLDTSQDAAPEDEEEDEDADEDQQG